MALPSDLAELPLGRRVYVLVIENPRVAEPARVLERRRPVVRQQLLVLPAEELPRLEGELVPDPPGPECHASAVLRSRAAASSTSIAASLMKPSEASCGNESSTPYDASACA